MWRRAALRCACATGALRARLGRPRLARAPCLTGSDARALVTLETAAIKARLAEDAWNTRDPERVALAYSKDSVWRNRSEFFQGRGAIRAFLVRKWQRELDYRLIKEVWAFSAERIAVRFAYECRNPSGGWTRAHGNEQWEFGEHGLMRRREASINDVPISEAERRFHWPLGPRPHDYPGLTELGL